MIRLSPRGIVPEGLGRTKAHGLTGSTIRVDIEATPSGHGYWILNQFGTVFAFGDAPTLGSGDVVPAAEAYVSISAAPDGQGYWLFTSRGRVVALGSAVFFGDMTAIRLNRPVLDSVATPSGLGGIFTFGRVAFKGSLGGNPPTSPVVAVASIGARPPATTTTGAVDEHESADEHDVPVDDRSDDHDHRSHHHDHSVTPSTRSTSRRLRHPGSRVGQGPTGSPSGWPAPPTTPAPESTRAAP